MTYLYQENAAQAKKIDELEKQNKIMKEVLAFYSDHKNWGLSDQPRPMSRRCLRIMNDEGRLPYCSISVFGGEKARQVLEKIIE